MLCVPHTLHNMGKNLDFPTLSGFFTPWLTLVQNTPAAKSRWRSVLGGCTSPATFSKVRWWSRWECWREVAINFGSLQTFLEKLVEDDIGDATTAAMIAIIKDPVKKNQLELELAAILSLERIVQATYRLEGDGLELLLAYDILTELRSYGDSLGKDASDLPNVAALLRKGLKIDIGTKVLEWFEAPYSDWFAGKVRISLPLVKYSKQRD